ncbi:hypothetical protein BJF79_15795 [Actinomadura sp. CNU-125]|uniref:nucleotidyl transferase AbiEii/AbiGii toxin family protein n=1 Tax=Actinomadura sp. CNU-125 TaxID=1904961 RepID=UPI00095DDA57|nr:nucleotidyl transferase AbiEii/AbiGii toxin family protein [Actinomadura sp. CNU-125]OLT20826.1 hypothetical protein BJF79_15795 [Actinomadura sp. CNU-125]
MSRYDDYLTAPSSAGPVFDDPARRARWQEARRTALGHVLAAISESAWADDLVLRGSVLLRAWYGERAREPGDIDFVVLPPELDARDYWARHMLDLLEAAVSNRTRHEDVEVIGTAAERSELWVYSDTPGMRLEMPWSSDDGPRGTVQVDFSFGEPLPVEPEVALVPLPGRGSEVPVRCATPGLSLAWKVTWLLTDDRPQPKDLYDAWLLAGHVGLDGDLEVPVRRRLDRLRDLEVGAAVFADACPQVDGPPARYVRELAERLGLNP